MRIHADWLTQSDERILEFLSDEGNHQPKGIHVRLAEAGLEYNASYVRRACSKLENYGMLQNVGGGTYSITEDGEAFLAGDLDARSLDGD